MYGLSDLHAIIIQYMLMNFNFSFIYLFWSYLTVYAHIYAYSGICGEVRGQLARIGSLFLSWGFQRLKLGHECPDSGLSDQPYLSEFQIWEGQRQTEDWWASSTQQSQKRPHKVGKWHLNWTLRATEFRNKTISKAKTKLC